MLRLQSYGSSNDNIIFSSEFFENNLFFKSTVLHQIGSDPKKIYFTMHSGPYTISLQKISQFCWPPRNRQGGPSGEWLIYSEWNLSYSDKVIIFWYQF